VYTISQIIEILKANANPHALEGMARYGINTHQTLGIAMPALRRIARQVGKDHDLAQQVWESGMHEARILAALIDKPEQVTEAQMEHWVKDFDSWDVCDQVCSNLFDRTPYAYSKALQWSQREDVFVKRAGFTLMAALAVHDKLVPQEKFRQFFPTILQAATDERNYVKKAVSWALRGIGKRSHDLNEEAIHVAEEIAKLDSRTAHWIASEARRELTSEKVQHRLRLQSKTTANA
jgi:3-methyladenine DNA glycosylase AlkD